MVALACANSAGNCYADDLPDSNNEDSNCDGVDGNAAAAIFVATTGSDLAPGTMDQPLRTLAAALAMAQKQTSKSQILMGYGDYQEPSTLSLVDGVGIYGGYDPAAKWTRSGDKPTTIDGGPLAMTARGFKLPTTLGRITVDAADGAQPGESSIALLAVDVGSMTLEDTCILQAGKGAKGAPGADGETGANGVAGAIGGNGAVDNQSSPGLGGLPGVNQACPDANGGPGGVGGSDPSFSGGKGGDSAAGVVGGAGGSNPGCSGVSGTDGNDAPPVAPIGADGTGGAAAGTFDDTTFAYVTADGADGQVGTDGSGGGGGGG